MKRFLLLLALMFAVHAEAQPINPIPADSISSRMFINLGTPPPGVIFYCVDCTQTATCAAAGTGAYAFRTLNAWSCSMGGSASFPLSAPDGSKTASSYAFSTAPNAGISYDPFAPGYVVVTGRYGSGTDATGGNIQLAAGRSTGTGVGGSIEFVVSPPGAASNATLNAHQTVAFFRYDNAISIGGLNTVSTAATAYLQGSNRAAGQTDGAGGDAWLRGGTGTGTGVGGNVTLWVAPPAATTGTTQHSFFALGTFSGANGSVVLGGVDFPTGGTSSFTGAGSTVTDTAGGPVNIVGGRATVGNANGGEVTMDGGAGVGTGIKGFVRLVSRTFATLGTPANGSLAFCSDCTIANPCAGAGTGALAKRLNAVWVCN